MLTQDELRHLPVIIEFLAVPSTFDIEYYLSMRESVGYFENKEINLDNVKFISDAIKSTPFFTLTRAPELTIASCLFCLEIFRELGLTLESISDQHMDSKFRGQNYKRLLHLDYKEGKKQHPFCIIVVNLYKFVEEGLLEPIITRLVDIEDRKEEVERAIRLLKN